MKYSKEYVTIKYAERGKSNIECLTDCNDWKDQITCKCNIHNYTWTAQFKSNLYKKYSCHMCAKEQIKLKNKKKYNLFKLRPDIANLLLNKEDAIGTSECCKDKKWFVCPNCNNKLYKSVVVVCKYGLACDVCSDGFSYPNKIMFNILTQLGIEFESEFSPSWISPKRYDFKFDKYIIEMDGGLGHGNKTFGNKTTIEQSIVVDKFKDDMAKKYGYSVIRIDCLKSDLEYIKNNILKSNLSKIFDLSNIDWDKCEYYSRRSILKDVCDYYRNNNHLSLKEISLLFNIHEDTVSKYLKIGFKNGLNPKYEKRTYSSPILCVDSNIVFKSALECSKYYGISTRSILKCCDGKQNKAGGLMFRRVKDVEINIDNLIPNYDIKIESFNNKRQVNMYDKNFKFVKRYESITSAARDNKTTLRTIIKSCNSKHKFNYGKTFYYADDPNQPDKTKIIA